LRIYLDSCALNRLTDPVGQLRVDQESDAMEEIFLRIDEGKITWVASTILIKELRKNSDVQRREDALGMLKFAAEIRPANTSVARRARTLEAVGYGAFDAFHLSIAEDSRVDLLITTDDRFLRKILRGLGKPMIYVANPLDLIRGRTP